MACFRDAVWEDGGGGCVGRDEGKILVFGEGNTEGVTGGGERGTAVGVRTLGMKEMVRIRFWWKMVELGEGMGTRE